MAGSCVQHGERDDSSNAGDAIGNLPDVDREGNCDQDSTSLNEQHRVMDGGDAELVLGGVLRTRGGSLGFNIGIFRSMLRACSGRIGITGCSLSFKGSLNGPLATVVRPRRSVDDPGVRVPSSVKVVFSVFIISLV